jgi:hypothetical protein
VQWEFRRNDRRGEFASNLPEQIHKVYLNGFERRKGWSLEGIRESLKRCDAFGLLWGPDRKDLLGYALYCLPEVKLKDAWFLWEDAICIRKKLHNAGLGRKALLGVCDLYPERTFGWVGGRTQSTIIMKRNAGLGPVFPFDLSYSEGDGLEVMGFLLQHISEVRDAKSFDPSKGICRGVYGRQLGKYPLDLKESEASEKLLASWGFSRKRGDAVVVVARVAALRYTYPSGQDKVGNRGGEARP